MQIQIYLKRNLLNKKIINISNDYTSLQILRFLLEKELKSIHRKYLRAKQINNRLKLRDLKKSRVSIKKGLSILREKLK